MRGRDFDEPDLLENSVVGLGLLKGGCIAKSNSRLASTFGYSVDEMRATPLHVLCTSMDAFEVPQANSQTLLFQGGPAAKDVELRRKDGSTFRGRCSVEAVDKHDLARGAILTVLDITEVKQAEQAMREAATQLRVIADNVPAMTIAYDEKLICLFANQRFAEYFGFTTTSILGKHLREIIGEEPYQEIKVHFDRVLEGHPTSYERTRRLGDGTARYLEVKLIPNMGDQGRVVGLFAVTTDVTERKEEENRIRRLAQQDPLTGVANRRLFEDQLRRAISLSSREGHRVAVLYIDLDEFKPVNDSLGHDAGDELLKSSAERIRQQLRESDCVARIGGDEFAVVLTSLEDSQDAAAAAQRILNALTGPFKLETRARQVTIGASIGIAVYPGDAQDGETLVKAADAAMYTAKQTGNCYRYCKAPEASA